MQWWVWLVVVLVLVVIGVVAFLGVQARRRSGGVISAGGRDGERS